MIHRSELDSKNRYNTYQHAGLPPGPIANPGRDALRAALHPLETDELYFVAAPGGGGRTCFQKTSTPMRKPWQAIVVGTTNENEPPPARDGPPERGAAKRTPRGNPAGRAARKPGKKQRILAGWPSADGIA